MKKIASLGKFIIYFIYLFSYILVYPCSIPPLGMLTLFLGEGVSQGTSDLIFITFCIIVTLVGSFILNSIFRFMLKLRKNNKITWIIFICHLTLIPLTYIYGFEIIQEILL